MNCGCGNKMGKYDKVCSSCRDKIRLLGEIREMFYQKKKNKKIKKKRFDRRETNEAKNRTEEK